MADPVPATPGVRCPGCGALHTSGHADSCACDHCSAPPAAGILVPADLLRRALDVIRQASDEAPTWRQTVPLNAVADELEAILLTE